MEKQMQDYPYCKYCIHKGILQDCYECWTNFNQAYRILQEADEDKGNKGNWYTADEIREILNSEKESKEKNNEMDIWLDLMAFVFNSKENFDEEFNRICEKYGISKEILDKKQNES